MGSRMQLQDGRVVSNFIVQALNNAPITIYGDGTQTRSFCYVDDLVDGTRSALRQSSLTGPVNLGNPHEFKITQLAQRVVELTVPSPLVYEPLPSDDPKQRKPDIHLAQTSLDWHPKIPLDAGLTQTINYFKSVSRAAPAAPGNGNENLKGCSVLEAASQRPLKIVTVTDCVPVTGGGGAQPD